MVYLRPFSRQDFPSLVRWSDSPEHLRLWSGSQFEFPLDEVQLERYLRESEESSSSWLFTAMVSSQEMPVGHLGLRNVNRRAGYGRIVDVVVDPSLRGQSIGRRMMYRLLEFGFDELSLHRIDLGVFEINRQAIRFYERLGFQKEGISRHVLKVGPDYWNMCQMSMLRPEWDVLAPHRVAG